MRTHHPQRANGAAILRPVSLLALAVALSGIVPGVRAQAQAPAFVQANAAPQVASQAVVTVPFTAAQSAGNLNVVVVGWHDATAHVQSVTDTSGHVYTRAVGPTARV